MPSEQVQKAVRGPAISIRRAPLCVPALSQRLEQGPRRVDRGDDLLMDQPMVGLEDREPHTHPGSSARNLGK
jgi:hypothetical protein